jgi:DNA-directed RNA polymerase specialized sigma24 family protein
MDLEFLKSLRFYLRKVKLPWYAPRDLLENQTELKFVASLRAGWLLDMIVRAAAQLGGVTPEAYFLDEDLIRDVEIRIWGLARVLARNPDDDDNVKAIAALARAELEYRVKGPYLATMLGNAWRDFLRKTRDERDREAGPDHIDNPRNVTPPPPPGPATSSEELEEKFRLLFGAAAKSEAHELLALVWSSKDRSAESRTPQSLVEDLATLTLPELSESWVQYFAKVEERDPADVERLFQGMLDKSRICPNRLYEYWDPVNTVRRWAEEMEKTVRLKPAECIPRQPVPKRVAYLYLRYLDYSPTRVVAEFGPLRADRLLADFAPEYAAVRRTNLESVRSKFAPFMLTSEAKAALFRDSYQPHMKIADWKYNVSRRFRAIECKQFGKSLRIICAAQAEPWKIMAFLHCHCLGSEPRSVVQEHRSLKSMKEALIPAFATSKHWEASVSEPWVKKSIGALTRKLVGWEGRALQDFSKSGNIGHDLSQWSGELLEAVSPAFVRNDQVRLFAIRHRIPFSTGNASNGTAA